MVLGFVCTAQPTSPQTLTTSAACSMKIWWPNLILEITCPGTSARRRCCWAMSCCRRWLGKASSVHTYTAPGRPWRVSGWHTAPFPHRPVAFPLTQGGAWPAPASHLADRTSPWGPALGPSQVGVGGVLRGLCFWKHLFLRTRGASPRPCGSEVPRSHCQAPPTVLGYVEGTVFAAPGKASQQNTGDTSLGPEAPPEDPARVPQLEGTRATGAPQRSQDSSVGDSSLFKKWQSDRHAHVQKDEIRLVPHTT